MTTASDQRTALKRGNRMNDITIESSWCLKSRPSRTVLARISLNTTESVIDPLRECRSGYGLGRFLVSGALVCRTGGESRSASYRLKESRLILQGCGPGRFPYEWCDAAGRVEVDRHGEIHSGRSPTRFNSTGERSTLPEAGSRPDRP